jgi:hypothetical protein
MAKSFVALLGYRIKAHEAVNISYGAQTESISIITLSSAAPAQ